MIIAICGKKHSGKSTAENMILRLIREGKPKAKVESYALAEPIKQIGAYLDLTFGKDGNEGGKLGVAWHSNEGKKGFVNSLGCTRREFLTKFGTDFAHKLNLYIWCDIFKAKWSNDSPHKTWIISDLRMKHEEAYFRRTDTPKTIIIKVVGDPADLEDGHNSNHKSETEVDSVIADYVIDTNATSKVDMILLLKGILRKHKLI